jgi:hypothetical protein
MQKKDEDNPMEGFRLPEPSSADLRGRQSVRATFKLTEKAIDALSIVSVHLGIKQKSLFDHLIDDMESLGLIAREVESVKFRRLSRIQKTYVLSRSTLSCLERAARDFDAPRDALVEYSIQRLLPIIIRERERHRKRKELLEGLGRYVKDGERLLRYAKKSLGGDDPVYDKLEGAIATLFSAYRHIDDTIKKGEVIEDF